MTDAKGYSLLQNPSSKSKWMLFAGEKRKCKTLKAAQSQEDWAAFCELGVKAVKLGIKTAKLGVNRMKLGVFGPKLGVNQNKGLSTSRKE